MRFSYQATDPEGEKLYQGFVEASSLAEARQKLRDMGLYPLSLSPARRVRRRRPRIGDLVLFAEQFASLIQAGVPLNQSLTTLSMQATDPTLKQALREVRARVEAGTSLSEAMRHYPEVFPPLMVRLVAAGELGGFLEVALSRIARYLDAAYTLQQEIKSALMYPVFVIFVVIAAVIGLLVFVVPVFARIYALAGKALPLPTQILLGISGFLRANGLWLLAALAAGAWAFISYARTPEGARVVGRWLVRLPIVGPLVHKNEIARFARTLASLYASGVNVVAALEAARDLVGNAFLRDAVDDVIEDVTKGLTLSQAMAKRAEIFLPLFVRMVGVGEESGQLDAMVDQAAGYIEREVSYSTKRLASMIEPVMTLVVGILVLGMALALYLPLFDLPQTLLRK